MALGLMRGDEKPMMRLYDGPLSGLPLDIQRAILRYHSEGVAPILIAKMLNVRFATVMTLIDRGVVQPKQLQKGQRCKCGAKVVCVPCMTCEIRGVVERKKEVK